MLVAFLRFICFATLLLGERAAYGNINNLFANVWQQQNNNEGAISKSSSMVKESSVLHFCKLQSAAPPFFTQKLNSDKYRSTLVSRKTTVPAKTTTPYGFGIKQPMLSRSSLPDSPNSADRYDMPQSGTEEPDEEDEEDIRSPSKKNTTATAFVYNAPAIFYPVITNGQLTANRSTDQRLFAAPSTSKHISLCVFRI